jgi:hypothetical protein
MTDSFQYSDAQWRRLEEIVKRAGRPAAKEKFNALRGALEKRVESWRQRIADWNGYTWDPDMLPKYRRVERAAIELKAALDDMNFPEILDGNDLLWITPERSDASAVTDTHEEWEKAVRAKKLGEYVKAVELLRRRAEEEWEEAQKAANLKRYEGFREALDHIRCRAALMEDISNRLVVSGSIKKRPRKLKFLPRDFFIRDLGQFWRDELALRISPSPRSHFVQFAEVASRDVGDLPRDTIVNVMRKLHAGYYKRQLLGE